MKKLLFCLSAMLSLIILLLLPTNHTLAKENNKSAKDLAKEFVSNKEVINDLNENEQQELENYVVTNHEKVLKKIEKKTDNNKQILKQTEALDKIWADLSEDEQLAYIVYSTPVEFEKEETNLSLPKNSALSYNTLAANKTNDFISTLTAKNVYGNTLFVYHTYNTWTYNGIKILSKSPGESYSIKSAGWRYLSKDVEAWTEYNDFDYFRNIEAFFEFSMAGYPFQHAEPHFKTKIRANGDWSSTKWINSSWG